MSIFYRNLRIGKNGKLFYIWKFKTLKDGTDLKTHFANEQHYTKYGKFLRKYKIDELPQLLNVLKGDMAFVGPRPEEVEANKIIPKEIKNIILSVKPGLTSLASLYFFDEERLLQLSKNPEFDYWTKIKPMKFLLDVFYVKNKCLSLDIWILWATLKKLLLAFVKKY